MSHKLLTVVCALALVLGLSFSATAAVQNVKVGGDITIRGIYQNAYDIYNEVENAAGVTQYDNNPTVHDYLIQQTRLYVAASLTDNVEAYVRLINDRDWGLNNFDAADDVEVDLAYLTLNEMYGYPCSLTIGRQELLYGEGFLVGDGIRGTVDTVNQTYQYDSRKSFDAIKAVWDYEPHQIDLFVAKITEGSNMDPLATGVAGVVNSYQNAMILWPNPLPRNTDNDLYGINWNYDGGVYGLWDFGLFHNRSNVVGSDIEGQLWALSVRGEGTLPQITNGTLALKGEIVKEWGMVEQNQTIGTALTGDAERLDAWGGYVEGEYTFDNAYAPYFGLGYIYMSGDDTGSDRIEQFNPLFEDEKFGEIADVVYGQYLLTSSPSNTSLRVSDAAMTNVQIWKLSTGFNPTENTALDLTFYSLTAPEEVLSLSGTIDDQRHYIGSEYDLDFTYNYSEDVTFGLLYALFIPGNFFEMGDDDTAAFDVSLERAQELMGSVTVVF